MHEGSSSQNAATQFSLPAPASLAEARSHIPRCLVALSLGWLLAGGVSVGDQTSGVSRNKATQARMGHSGSTFNPASSPDHLSPLTSQHQQSTQQGKSHGSSTKWGQQLLEVPCLVGSPLYQVPPPMLPNPSSSCWINPSASHFLFSMSLGLYFFLFFDILGSPPGFLKKETCI